MLLPLIFLYLNRCYCFSMSTLILYLNIGLIFGVFCLASSIKFHQSVTRVQSWSCFMAIKSSWVFCYWRPTSQSNCTEKPQWSQSWPKTTRCCGDGGMEAHGVIVLSYLWFWFNLIEKLDLQWLLARLLFIFASLFSGSEAGWTQWLQASLNTYYYWPTDGVTRPSLLPFEVTGRCCPILPMWS